MTEKVDIPIDVFESQQEIVVIIPLWWVKKSSLEVYLEQTSLLIKGERIIPNLKDSLSPIQQECFRWQFSKTIQLPQNVYFDKIQSNLTKENILIITIPKIIIPEKIQLEVKSL